MMVNTAGSGATAAGANCTDQSTTATQTPAIKITSCSYNTYGGIQLRNAQNKTCPEWLADPSTADKLNLSSITVPGLYTVQHTLIAPWFFVVNGTDGATDVPTAVRSNARICQFRHTLLALHALHMRTYPCAALLSPCAPLCPSSP